MRRFRPRLEALEERAVPATFYWVGGTVQGHTFTTWGDVITPTGAPPGSLNRISGWASSTGGTNLVGGLSTVVPDGDDLAVFDNHSVNCSVTGNTDTGALSATSGFANTLTVANTKVLTLTGGANSGVSTWAGGTLMLGGDTAGVDVYFTTTTNQLNVTGGSIDGQTNAGVTGGGQLTIDDGAEVVVSGAVTNFDPYVWVGYNPSHSVKMYGGTLTFDPLNADLNMHTASINNTGTVNFKNFASAGVGFINNGGIFDNYGGVVDVNPTGSNQSVGAAYTFVSTTDGGHDGVVNVGTSTAGVGFNARSFDFDDSSSMVLFSGGTVVVTNNATFQNTSHLFCSGGNGATWAINNLVTIGGGTLVLSSDWNASTNVVFGTLTLDGSNSLAGITQMHVSGNTGGGGDVIQLDTDATLSLSVTVSCLDLYTKNSGGNSPLGLIKKGFGTSAVTGSFGAGNVTQNGDITNWTNANVSGELVLSHP